MDDNVRLLIPRREVGVLVLRSYRLSSLGLKTIRAMDVHTYEYKYAESRSMHQAHVSGEQNADESLDASLSGDGLALRHAFQ